MRLINKTFSFFDIKLMKNSEYIKLENENIELRNENNRLINENKLYKKNIESKKNDGLAPSNIVKYNNNINLEFSEIEKLSKALEYLNNKYFKKYKKNNENDKNFKEFNEEKKCKNWADKVYGQWAKNITKKHDFFNVYKMFKSNEYKVLNSNITAIEIYMGNGYQEINKILRGCKSENKIGEDIALIDKLVLDMIFAPSLPMDIIVYRSVDDDTFEEIINEIMDKGEFTEKGFMSTTLYKNNIVKKNGDYDKNKGLLKIYIKKGEIGIYTSLFKDRTKENEMLFFPGGKLTIKNKPFIDEITEKEERIVLECWYNNDKLDIKNNMNEVIKTMLDHRTTRSFVKGKELPKEHLEQIIASSKQGSSWMNGQHYSIIVTTGDTKQQIADLIRDKAPGNAAHIENSAAFLLYCLDYTNIKLAFDIEGGEFDITNQHEPLLISTLDVGIAMQNAALAAESLGYGIVYCGGVRGFGDKISELLKIPENALFLCGLSIGVKDEELSTEKVKPRLPEAANVGYNEFPKSNVEVLKEYRQTMVDFAEECETKTWTKKFADFYAQPSGIEKVTKEQLEKNGFVSEKE